MRVWDVDVRELCDRHLLGEHRELHAIWSILTNGRSGYANHPETVRWRGRLAALYARHQQQLAEMARRGFNHGSPLDGALATGEARQSELVDSMADQRARLAAKDCGCLRVAGLAVPVEGEAHDLGGPRP
jgi:pyrimidine dimer DNA glycosylase